MDFFSLLGCCGSYVISKYLMYLMYLMSMYPPWWFGELEKSWHFSRRGLVPRITYSVPISILLGYAERTKRERERERERAQRRERRELLLDRE